MEVGLGEGAGAAMVGEVEEVSLDEVLTTLRQSLKLPQNPTLKHSKTPKQTTIPPLDALTQTHTRHTLSPNIALTGRALPLLYALTSRLLSSNKTILIIDLESRFDTTRLACSEADLRHAYVLRPRTCLSAEEVRSVIKKGERWIVYGGHGSKGREWWGTVVVGGPGGDVSAGWRGWARVEREGGSMFGRGISAEEALQERRDGGEGWLVRSEYGGFTFKEGELARGNLEGGNQTG